MDVLLITDVPAGITAVTATINSDSGLVWLPGTSTLGVYTTAADSNVALTQTLVGSGRYAAPRPALPVGGYTVIYRADGEVVGHERVTVGTSAVTIVVEPMSVDPIGPRAVGNDFSVYMNTAETILFSNLRDRNGNAVDLAGKNLRFAVDSSCRRSTRQFQVDGSVGGFGGAFSSGFSVADSAITVTGGTVAVQLSLANTAKCFEGRYALRNITDGVVLATGAFSVESAPVGVDGLLVTEDGQSLLV